MQHKTPQCILLVTKIRNKTIYLKYVTCLAGFSGNVLLLFFIVNDTVIYSYYLQKPYIWQNCTVKLQVTLYNKILVFNALSNYQWEKTFIHWRKRYYGLWTHIFVKSVLMLDQFQLLSSPDVNWWTGVEWIIVVSLSDSHSDGTHSLQSIYWLSFWRHPFTAEHPLTLILTAPIHCRASIDSYSDGTHSLQSVHCWDTDAETHFSKPDEETNSSWSWMAWGCVNQLLAELFL